MRGRVSGGGRGAVTGLSDAGLVWAMTLGAGGSFHKFSLMRDGYAAGVWLPVRGSRRSFERLARADDCLVSAVPRYDDSQGWPARTTVLWAVLESAKDAQALKAFRPAPTLVLREGLTVRRVALWWLWSDLALDDGWGIRANKRIAHKLGTKKKWAEFTFTLRPPGTILRKGRAKPVVVHVEHRDDEAVYEPRAIVARLKDPPAPRDWKSAA